MNGRYDHKKEYFSKKRLNESIELDSYTGFNSLDDFFSELESDYKRFQGFGRALEEWASNNSDIEVTVANGGMGGIEFIFRDTSLSKTPIVEIKVSKSAGGALKLSYLGDQSFNDTIKFVSIEDVIQSIDALVKIGRHIREMKIQYVSQVQSSFDTMLSILGIRGYSDREYKF